MNGSNQSENKLSKNIVANKNKDEDEITVKHEKAIATIQLVQQKTGHEISKIEITGTDIPFFFEGMKYYTPCELKYSRLDDISEQTSYEKVGRRAKEMKQRNKTIQRRLNDGCGFLGIIQKVSDTFLSKDKIAYKTLELVTNLKTNNPKVLTIFLWRESYTKFSILLGIGDIILVRGSPILTLSQGKGNEINLHTSTREQIVVIGKCSNPKSHSQNPKTVKRKKKKNKKANVEKLIEAANKKKRHTILKTPQTKTRKLRSFCISRNQAKMYNFGDQSLDDTYFPKYQINDERKQPDMKTHTGTRDIGKKNEFSINPALKHKRMFKFGKSLEDTYFR